jgi:hypothetical protein
MCGGGFLGKFAAEQPADFYVDSRVGSLPYPVEQIEQAVRALRAIAEGAGLNPHAMPPLLPFHAAGVF